MSAIKLHYEVDGTDFTRAGEASAAVKKTLRQLGINPGVIRKVAIALYEGEINMVIHADGGYIDVEIHPDKITLALCDKGKGIENIELARTPMYTTGEYGERCGMGFLIMENLCDSVTVKSRVGKGTTVLLRKYLGPGRCDE